MDVYDLIALPVYLAIIYFLANYIRGKHSGNRLYQQYFIRGLNYKVIGALGYSVIYWFYYKGGDSINFYYTITPTYKLLFNNPSGFFSFVFSSVSEYPEACLYDCWLKDVTFLTRGSASLTTIRIGSLLNLFAFNSYIALVLIIAFVSYLFTWQMFLLFTSQYPKLKKELVIGFLMLPSLLFWGSGIGKDAIMFSALMNLVYCFYDMVIRKRNILKNMISLLITAYLISFIRSYVLFTMGPSLILMAGIYYRNLFRSPAVRFIALPVFLVGGLAGSFLFIRSVGSSVSTYNVESLQQTAEGFHSWHTTLGQTQGGSFYSLGDDVDYTTTGIIRKAPLALIITLFGPFFWQIRNPVMLMSGAESIVFLYYFIKVFFSVRIYRAYSILFSDHIIMLCMLFVVIMGIAIGITSFNYGALVRYRLPILPFFVTLIAVTNYKLTGKGLLK
jgi:hypothetical protein